jgi:hypothetical protein
MKIAENTSEKRYALAFYPAPGRRPAGLKVRLRPGCGQCGKTLSGTRAKKSLLTLQSH